MNREWDKLYSNIHVCINLFSIKCEIYMTRPIIWNVVHNVHLWYNIIWYKLSTRRHVLVAKPPGFRRCLQLRLKLINLCLEFTDVFHQLPVLARLSRTRWGRDDDQSWLVVTGRKNTTTFVHVCTIDQRPWLRNRLIGGPSKIWRNIWY